MTTPLIIRELDRIARDRGWTTAELAAELGLHRTNYVHLRSGRRHLTARLLSRILTRFPEITTLSDHALFFLKSELPEALANQLDATVSTATGTLPPVVRTRLDTYIRHFPRENLLGRGLYIFGGETDALFAVSCYVRDQLTRRGVVVMSFAGNATPAASELRAALAAPLVIAERLDVASAAILDLIRRRADLVRPIIVTSIVPPQDVGDAHLRRIFLSMTPLVHLRPQ